MQLNSFPESFAWAGGQDGVRNVTGGATHMLYSTNAYDLSRILIYEQNRTCSQSWSKTRRNELTDLTSPTFETTIIKGIKCSYRTNCITKINVTAPSKVNIQTNHPDMLSFQIINIIIYSFRYVSAQFMDDIHTYTHTYEHSYIHTLAVQHKKTQSRIHWYCSIMLARLGMTFKTYEKASSVLFRKFPITRPINQIHKMYVVEQWKFKGDSFHFWEVHMDRKVSATSIPLYVNINILTEDRRRVVPVCVLVAIKQYRG